MIFVFAPTKFCSFFLKKLLLLQLWSKFVRIARGGKGGEKFPCSFSIYDYWAACDKVNRNIGFVVSVAKLMAARKQRTGQTEHQENRLRLQAVEPDAPR